MPQSGHNSNSASPPLSPVHGSSVITDHPQHICGVPVGEYSRKGRRGLQICHSCKGRIVIELFSLVAPKGIPTAGQNSTAAVQTLADGSFLPVFEGELWKRCGLDFPGLAHLRPTWGKLVVHIAKELAANVKNEEGVMALLPTTLTVWDVDETAAYRWWKQGNAQRAKHKMGGVGASVKSEVTYQPSIKTNVLDSHVLVALSAGLGLEKTQHQETQPTATSSTRQNLSVHKIVSSAPEASAQTTANVTSQPAPGLDVIEKRLHGLIQRHNSVQEATTKAINCEEFKRHAEVNLAATAAHLESARQTGSQEEIILRK
ncbi:hypothetical protein CEP53_014379 [Fusarium sp. AF-6]|nr:hypothetical protein CEP53_014379 [Fusarium sp. AF-6]